MEVQIERGKTLIIRLDEIGEPDIDGNRVLFFNLNGQRREVLVKDASIKSAVQVKQKAEPTNKEQIGATMSGSVLQVLVKRGDKVERSAVADYRSHENGNDYRSTFCGHGRSHLC